MHDVNPQTNATQRQSACFIYIISTIYRQAMPLYANTYEYDGWIIICLSTLIRAVGKLTVGGQKWPTEIFVHGWLDFHLLPTTGGEVNVVVPRFYHHQPQCPLTPPCFFFYHGDISTSCRDSSRQVCPHLLYWAQNGRHVATEKSVCRLVSQ